MGPSEGKILKIIIMSRKRLNTYCITKIFMILGVTLEVAPFNKVLNVDEPFYF